MNVDQEGGGKDAIKQDVNLRYCMGKEVAKKRLQFLVFSAYFGLKLKHLKSKGEMIDTFAKLNDWVYENVEALWADDNMRNRFDNNTGGNKLKLLFHNKEDQEDQEMDKDKEMFLNKILDYCEDILIKRRRSIRCKKYEYVKE